jgi:hypothetical protein
MSCTGMPVFGWWYDDDLFVTLREYEASGELRETLLLYERVPPDHLLLDSAPNLGPLIFRWEIDKFENFRHKCQDFRGSKAFVSANFWICQVPNEIRVVHIGDLSNKRWSGRIGKVPQIPVAVGHGSWGVSKHPVHFIYVCPCRIRTNQNALLSADFHVHAALQCWLQPFCVTCIYNRFQRLVVLNFSSVGRPAKPSLPILSTCSLCPPR